MTGWGWWAAAGAAVLMLVLFRRPLESLFRLAVRSGLGMVFLWLFQGLGGLLGVHLGVNLLNSLILCSLGAPGLALLMLVQWTVR